MSTSAQTAAAIRANLEQAMLSASQRLTELLAQPISVRAYITYTEGEQTYNWGEYYDKLQDQFDKAEARLKAMQAMGDPITVAGPLGWA